MLAESCQIVKISNFSTKMKTCHISCNHFSNKTNFRNQIFFLERKEMLNILLQGKFKKNYLQLKGKVFLKLFKKSLSLSYLIMVYIQTILVVKIAAAPAAKCKVYHY